MEGGRFPSFLQSAVISINFVCRDEKGRRGGRQERREGTWPKRGQQGKERLLRSCGNDSGLTPCSLPSTYLICQPSAHSSFAERPSCCPRSASAVVCPACPCSFLFSPFFLPAIGLHSTFLCRLSTLLATQPHTHRPPSARSCRKFVDRSRHAVCVFVRKWPDDRWMCFVLFVDWLNH